MFSEKHYTPEQELRPKVSLKDFFQGVQKKIKLEIDAFLGKTDKDIAKFEDGLNVSADLSRGVGRLYQALARHSLHPVTKEYEDVAKSSFLVGAFGAPKIERLNALKDKMPAAEFKLEKQISIKSRFKEQPPTIREQKLDSYTYQLFDQRIHQKGGLNTITEHVENGLNENGNIAYAHLLVHNLATGNDLDINEFLPNDVGLVPATMKQVEEQLDPDTMKMSGRILPVDLKSYHGNQFGSLTDFVHEEISFAGGQKKIQIQYGDLTSKGNMLALLHEIAHAWQAAMYEELRVRSFEDLYNSVLDNLSEVEIGLQFLEEGEYSKEAIMRFLEPRLARLKELGVEVDIDNLIFKGQELGSSDKLVANKYMDKILLINSDRLQGIVAGYVRQERDASAHAIRVIRALRKQGIDLEPEMKTADDFKQAIHGALAYYQATADNIVNFGKGQKKFTIKNYLEQET